MNINSIFKSCLLLQLIFINYSWSQNKSPNIILMIGDGMGLTQISSGMYANGNSTALEEFQYIGLSKTNSSNSLVTDSAASGTAMATGVKTLNKVLGIDSKNVSTFSKKIISEIIRKKIGFKGILISDDISIKEPTN